jgi:radical SAM superfamily enzyme YgiQ (UPF0313 family)
MITVNLCTALNIKWGEFEPYFPIGILSLAAIAEAEGCHVVIKDRNTEFQTVDEINYLQKVAGYLVDNKPDILGFTTLCTLYPQTLRLAEACKRLHPDVIILLGGPQASVTAPQTMKNFNAIDCIIIGEGEIPFTRLIQSLKNGGSWNEVPSLVWRQNSTITQNKRAGFIEDMDSILPPAYHLNPFPISERGSLPVEAGRGCPYRCTFCSTTNFWGNRSRMKSVSRLISDISQIITKYGVEQVGLVHDNFTSSPNYVREFCTALKEEVLNVSWNCSARIDVVDNQLLEEMASSGCDYIFYGIESGSQSIHYSIGKKLKLSKIVENAELTANHSITMTNSFIIGFPEEDLDTLKQTLNLLLKFRFIGETLNFTQLHLLMPETGTLLEKEFSSEIVFDELPPDPAMLALTPSDISLIQKYPDLFSGFYHIPTPNFSIRYLRKVFLIMYFSRFLPFTQYILWKRENENLVDLILENADCIVLDRNYGLPEGEFSLFTKVYQFYLSAILPAVANHAVLKELLRYEYWASMVKQAGTHIEYFSFDVEQFLTDIQQYLSDETIVQDWHPTGYLFVYKNGEVKTAKLAEPLKQLLNSSHFRP